LFYGPVATIFAIAAAVVVAFYAEFFPVHAGITQPLAIDRSGASVTIVDLPAGTTVSGLELFEAVQTVGGVDPVGAIVADANDGGNVSPARSL
jgi:hypothetical protein